MTAESPSQLPTPDERIAYFMGLVGLRAAEGALALLTEDEAEIVRRVSQMRLQPDRVALIREHVIADVDLPARRRRGPGWLS